MYGRRLTRFVPALALTLALPVSAMEIAVHVQDRDTGTPIAEAYVRYIFNPGTAVADTADGYADVNGNLVLHHDVVSGAGDVPFVAVSRPYPNPAGRIVRFDIEAGGGEAPTSFALYDVRGRLVARGDPRGGAAELPRPLAGGNYLYRLGSGSAVVATGKLDVLDRLERIEFRVGAAAAARAAGDPVDILVQSRLFTDYVDSKVLLDGQHDETIAMTIVGPCERCLIAIEDYEAYVDALAPCSYPCHINAANTMCADVILAARPNCMEIVFTNYLYVAQEVYMGTSVLHQCQDMGYCGNPYPLSPLKQTYR